jgi:hypothetical protein
VWWCVGVLVAAAVVFLVWQWLDPNERQARTFEAALAARPPVPDAELVARYFDAGGVPPAVPPAVRRVFAEYTGYPAERLMPDDDLAFVWAELDAAEFVAELEDRLGVAFRPSEEALTPCTIRAVSELVARKWRRAGRRSLPCYPPVEPSAAPPR